MCGIFAFAGHDLARPDPEILVAAAEGAARRGVHSHGWVTGDPQITAHHLAPGLLSEHLDEVKVLTSSLILGHSRLATSGQLDGIRAAQPLIDGGEIALAHNGTINDPAVTCANANYPLPDLQPWESDSFALLYAYLHERMMTAPHEALGEVCDRLTSAGRPQAVVVLDSGRVYAWRMGHPLWSLPRPEGTYVASQPFHDGCTLTPERKVAWW